MRGISGREWEVLSNSLIPSKELIDTYGRVLAQLLINRGFEKEPENFLELKLKKLPPFSFLPNIEEGVERIARAVSKGERIIVFGDYDVDGITGTAILYEVLKEAGARVVPVLPSRTGGYGLNRELMKLFSRYGDLLITVDNGTSAVEEIEGASIDTIIIDHHNVPEKTPSRGVLINPKLSSSIPEDLKELSSSGMCFYMASLLVKRLSLEKDVRRLLDFVALGTVGDVMPMNPTNRILVSKGISLLENFSRLEIERPGLKALLEVSGVKDSVSVRDIAFNLAPRLNAPGRINNPDIALQLLLEKDIKKARLLAQKIDSINRKRKAISDKVYRQAYSQAVTLEGKSFIVLWSPHWPVGILGIVAGRLSSELGKPVAIFFKGNTYSVGSIRSVEGIDIYSPLSKLSYMFLKWGGHSQAAGITLESSLLTEFSQRAEELFSNLPRESSKLYIDMELPLESLTPELEISIRKLEPFGEKNPPPTFLDRVVVEKVSFRGHYAVLNVRGRYLLCGDRKISESLASRLNTPVKLVYSFDSGRLSVVDVEEEHGSRKDPRAC